MNVRPLTPELLAKSIGELNEVPERTPSDVSAVRQWLSQQPHLAEVKISDQRILAFLRGCKFSLERCKQKLDMYYTMKNLAPELFSNRDPLDPTLQKILKLGVTLPLLETASADDTRIYFIRLGAYNTSKFQLSDILKVSFMITDILMQEDDNYIVSGQTLLLDFKGATLTMVGQFTPGLAKKVTTSTEKVYPLRQKGNHMINTPQGFETGFNIFKSFLSEKNKSRIRVHNKDMDSLYSQLPKKILPKDLGGDSMTIAELTEYWKKKVESYRDWYLEEDRYRSDESLRPGKPKTSEDLFGIEGSFRRLDFD